MPEAIGDGTPPDSDGPPPTAAHTTGTLSTGAPPAGAPPAGAPSSGAPSAAASSSGAPAGVAPAGGAPAAAPGQPGPGPDPKGSDHAPAAMGHAAIPARLLRSRRIPEATVARLPVYLRCLLEMAEAKTATISSERLAELAGVNAAKVRKDLSYLGSYGTRGVGYDVEYLLSRSAASSASPRTGRSSSSASATWATPSPTTAGSRPAASAIVALVDADPAKVGERVGGVPVRHVDDLAEVVAEHGVAIGIIATPADGAQDVADRLVAAGRHARSSTSPPRCSPSRPSVSLRKVDLSIELQILSFYQQRRAGGTGSPPSVATVG